LLCISFLETSMMELSSVLGYGSFVPFGSSAWTSPGTFVPVGE
jgi:hypothetical protein